MRLKEELILNNIIINIIGYTNEREVLKVLNIKYIENKNINKTKK